MTTKTLYHIHDSHTGNVYDNGKAYTLKAAQKRMAALDKRSNIVLSFYLTKAR